jgi:hypothetical protein
MISQGFALLQLGLGVKLGACLCSVAHETLLVSFFMDKKFFFFTVGELADKKIL